MRSLRALMIGVGGVLLFAMPALAHGPTIEISPQEMKPPLLNLFVGTTVHFLNKVESKAGHVVVDAAGAIESPPLSEVGSGWHYTFEEVGTYQLRLRDHPGVKAKIVIVPRRGGPIPGPGSPGPGRPRKSR